MRGVLALGGLGDRQARCCTPPCELPWPQKSTHLPQCGIQIPQFSGAPKHATSTPEISSRGSLKRFFAVACDKASSNAFVALHGRARHASKAAI
jgi:hypothetical protein